MSCPESLLLDYSTGKLEEGDRVLLERHMLTCASCERFRSEQTALWQALEEWQVEPVSTTFNRDLWKRIDAAAATPWYRKLVVWKPAVPLTAAIAVVGIGFLLDHRPVGNTPAVNVVSSVEAEQAERVLDDIRLLQQLDGTGG